MNERVEREVDFKKEINKKRKNNSKKRNLFHNDREAPKKTPLFSQIGGVLLMREIQSSTVFSSFGMKR